MYQQGDVLFKAVGSTPGMGKRVAARDGRFVLVEGETTGHAHTIAADGCELLELEHNGQRDLYMRVTAPSVTVQHQEHLPITLARGTYLVDRVRELDFFEGL